ncbi:hypothetical protein [Plebeiibacterium marinum]|uniref:Uncharacterized protein n=1 Tax=Plebeiibacterium marinum TaxID=2992111 RepID=A0AAE3MGD7_9BACT|nr:hypothetical protein [Plebeiobacterium marinum]MCW3807343.1 hypothetical protein [Plebeiobacterium marinum]
MKQPTKFLSTLILLVSFYMVIGCTGNKTTREINSNYVGVWNIRIKEMPKVGDVSFEMSILKNDSVYSGYFVELNGDTVFFNKIELDDEYLNTKYEWGGHNVGFRVKLKENNINELEGSFMRFFDIEGMRK